MGEHGNRAEHHQAGARQDGRRNAVVCAGRGDGGKDARAAQREHAGRGRCERQREVHRERKRAPQGSGVQPGLARLLVDKADIGKRAHERADQPKPRHSAQRVRDQVVHVEQPVRVLVQTPKARELRKLERQRHGEADEQGLPPRAAEVVAQVHAKGHQQQHVEQRLVDVRAAYRGDPRGRVGGRERGMRQELPQEVEGSQLGRGGVGDHGGAVGRQREQYKNVRAHQVEDERVHDKGPQPGDRAESSVLVDKVRQRDQEGGQRECGGREDDVRSVRAHVRRFRSMSSSALLRRADASAPTGRPSLPTTRWSGTKMASGFFLTAVPTDR